MGSYPEPDESSPQPQLFILKIHFNIIPYNPVPRSSLHVF